MEGGTRGERMTTKDSSERILKWKQAVEKKIKSAGHEKNEEEEED